MAQRRMFSPNIVDSDAFLDMPASSQLLYFHLGMRADDDGFVANASSQRRTGVFRAGNGTQFTKEIAGAVSGSNLLEVYPSPANGDVTVNFIVPVQGFVSVDLYNTLGQKVTDITNGMFNADRYSASFNVSNLPSGTYQVRIANELFTKSTSIVVTK